MFRFSGATQPLEHIIGVWCAPVSGWQEPTTFGFLQQGCRAQVLIFYAARMCVRWCFAEWRINFLLLRGPVPGMIRGEYAETFFGCAVRDPVVISKIAIDRFCFVSVVPTRCF